MTIAIAVAIAIAIAVAISVAVAVATTRSRAAYGKLLPGWASPLLSGRPTAKLLSRQPTSELLAGRSTAVMSRRPAASRPFAPGRTLSWTCLLGAVRTAVSVSEGRRDDKAGPAEGHQQNRSTDQFPETFRRTGLPEGRFWAFRKNAHGSLHFRLSANLREAFSREYRRWTHVVALVAWPYLNLDTLVVTFDPHGRPDDQ